MFFNFRSLYIFEKMAELFPKPVLRFKKGTTLFPANGFKYGLEPYSGPDRIRLGLMARKSLGKHALSLVRNIVFGIHSFKGMAKWFKTYIEFPPKTVLGKDMMSLVMD